MALNIKCVTLTQSGTGTGSQTIELGDNFDPKAAIVVAAPVASDGIAQHASMAVGFCTFRGAAVQQNHTDIFAEDAVGTADTYNRTNTDAVAILMDGTGAADMTVTCTGMTTGVGADITFNITGAHTTTNVRLFIMVFGGDDLVDAQAHSFNIAAGTGAQDVTLGSGFGHPDVVFFTSTAFGDGTAGNAGATLSIGFGIRGGSSRSIAFASADGSATEATAQRINNNAAAFVTSDTFTAENVFTLAAEAGWPTDGYEINKTTASANEAIHGLALRFSTDVTVTDGEGSMPTSGGLPVTQDLAVGSSTPKGLLVLHTRQTTANTSDTTSTNAALLAVGMVDQDQGERWVGAWDDDGQGTSSVASSGESTAKAVRTYLPSTDALDGEADGLISGSNFRLSFNDLPPSAFLYEWVAFGEVGGAAPTSLVVPRRAHCGLVMQRRR